MSKSPESVMQSVDVFSKVEKKTIEQLTSAEKEIFHCKITEIDKTLGENICSALLGITRKEHKIKRMTAQEKDSFSNIFSQKIVDHFTKNKPEYRSWVLYLETKDGTRYSAITATKKIASESILTSFAKKSAQEVKAGARSK